jgi:hypothetical protein
MYKITLALKFHQNKYKEDKITNVMHKFSDQPRRIQLEQINEISK